MASWITPIELKNDFALPVTSAQWQKLTDATIQKRLDSATRQIENWLDRRIPSAYYTERIVGTGRYTLMMEEYPMTQLVSVSSRDISENTESFDTGDFLIHGGAAIIEWKDKLRYNFRKDRVWVVNYRAGYDIVPDELKEAVALQAVESLQPMFRGGADFVQVDLIEGLNSRIVDLCEFYKRKRLG